MMKQLKTGICATDSLLRVAKLVGIYRGMITTLFMFTLLIVFGGCGSGLDSSSDSGSGSVASTVASGTSSSCNSTYPDKISSATRTQAKADEAQCGSQVANADSLLAAARATCQLGDVTSAAANYKNYQTVATYATSVVAQLCGGSTAPTLPGGGTTTTTNPSTYSLYVEYGVPVPNTGRVVLGGTCTTATVTPPVPSGNVGTKYSSVYYEKAKSGLTLSQCKSAATSYGLSF